MVETKAVSVRLPLDLLNELNTYATDKGMVRSGDANIGGAIIAILKERFFDESDNVKQVSNNVDIESIVNVAVESRLEAVLNQVDSLRLDVHSHKTDALLYEKLQSDIKILTGDIDIKLGRIENRLADLEATASAKKLKIVA